MSENIQLVLAIAILIAVYALTRKYHAWRMKQTYMAIIRDLEQKRAMDPSSAIALLYARPSLFRFGIRDYRPKALEYLTISDIVGITESGKYFLKKKAQGPLAPNNPHEEK
jgi:hypothetical protein